MPEDAVAAHQTADSARRSPREELTTLLEQQFKLPKFRRIAAHLVPAAVADALIACVKTPQLDLSGVTSSHALLLANVPAIWGVLRREAGQAITSVHLSADLSHRLASDGEGKLFVGLNSLGPDFAHLVLTDPPEGIVDLLALAPESGPPPTIEIRCTVQPQAWEVRVGHGADVYANSAFVSQVKSRVVYERRDGPPQTRTLGGLIYDHQAKDPELRARARATKLNGAGTYGDGDQAVCRHGATWWATRRYEHRQPGGRPFPQDVLVDAQAVAQHIDPDTEDEYLRIRAAGARALVPQEHFGDLCAKLFRGLAVGESRQFLLESPKHTMAFEVLVKSPGEDGGPREDVEFVVNFFDFNFGTQLHERRVDSDPARLSGKRLQDWMATGDIAHLFEADDEPRFCLLYPVFAKGGQPPPLPVEFLEFVPPEQRLAPYVLFAGMQEGRQDVVRGVLESARARHDSGSVHAQALHQLLGASSEGFTAFTGALAFCRGPECFTLVEHMLSAPADAIDPARRLALLESRIPAGSEDGEPLLHAVASDTADPEDRIAQIVYTHLGMVGASQLPHADKMLLFTAGHDGSTAAQAALSQGNPTVAAAIVCAVLEARLDAQDLSRALAAVGVEIREVLEALTRSSNPLHARWVGRVLDAMERSGFRPDEARMLRREFAR
ncbi:MAG TPA: ShET2/EspL2 family type III secretion system effector toxin [Ramlibacter sp.]|uniref:ShET2/EspL2 family type III secretion system effector toxin n=1 Tax=Ramlibacter sp. TaxID=1917967 RepID=UPI002C597339|nr:ShET2/EspL2 family type III secretion system effector toxin [Ramlibacter sp.]HVZ46856.1 ShET2/EspL2 family type III secretion system effector toxin [Ramlibacter sp.]